MNLKGIAKSVAFVAALVTAGGVMAADQGDLDVTVSIADRVQVTGLDDIALGAYSGTGALVGSSTFCVYRNGTGRYNLRVSSSVGFSSRFAVSNGTDMILYTLKVDDDTDASDGRRARSARRYTGMRGNRTASDCGGADNASLEVTFSESALQSAPLGVYTDTLIVLVEPD